MSGTADEALGRAEELLERLERSLVEAGLGPAA